MRLGARSRLEVSGNTNFTGNVALAGSGGAVLCDKCHGVDLSNGTVFENNLANRHGGAISLLNPISASTKSSGSVFRGNTAETGDGELQEYDPVVENSWSSASGDRYEGNYALHGSGGAFAALGTTIHLRDGASCANNSAPQGGGGCDFWDPLSDLAESATWKQFAPSIESDKKFVFSGNLAAYGHDIATAPYL